MKITFPLFVGLLHKCKITKENYRTIKFDAIQITKQDSSFSVAGFLHKPGGFEVETVDEAYQVIMSNGGHHEFDNVNTVV